MNKPLMLMLFLLILISMANIVYAEPVDVSQFPQALADALGFSLFAGQLMASCIILALFLFPTMLLMNKRSNQPIGIVIVGLASLSLCVALGWLPIFVLLVICLFTAGLLGTKMKEVFT